MEVVFVSTSDERRSPLDDDSVQAGGIGFMVHSLLSSRLDTGMNSEDTPGEDEVNVYLTHLLCAYVDPRHNHEAAHWVAPYDSAVFERVRRSTSNSLKYRVYRANADFLLMSIGVFGNAVGRRAMLLPEPLQTEDDVYVGRGKAYYDFASTYSRTLFGRGAAITHVLGRLAFDFEKYVRLLAHLRTEYLNLIQQMSDGELYHLQRSVTTEGNSELYNELLDAYSEWRQEPSAERRARVEALVERVRAADPEFRFEWPEA
jgi:hypothetical protein